MATRRKRGRPRKTAVSDREIPIRRQGVIGVPFTNEDGEIRGTASDLKGRVRAYGASSAVHRGTANEIKVKFLADRRAKGEDHLCVCGCEQEPSQPDSLFMPGHDSKVRSMGLAILNGQIKLNALPKIAQEYLKASGMLDQSGPARGREVEVEAR